MPDVTEWVWVKDLSTGYRYDIPAVWLDENGSYPGVQVIAAKPRHFGPNARPAKYPAEIVTTTERDPGPDQTAAAPADGADAAPAASTTEEQ